MTTCRRCEVRLLPTPSATEYGNNQSPSAGAAVRPSLDGLVKLLPTPNAADGEGGKIGREETVRTGKRASGTKAQISLREAVTYPPSTSSPAASPCKGASTAGKRQGFGHAETVLWHEMRRVIGEVRPRYVVIENVANILGMAATPGEPAGSLWGSVLADLAALGFGDIRWDCVPAAAVGAPHLRDRVFCVASLAGALGERNGGQRRQPNGRADVAGGGDGAATDADDAHGQGHWSAERVRAQVAGDHGVDPESAADAEPGGRRADERDACPGQPDPARGGVAVEWGDYRPAIERWEAVHGEAPAPLVSRVRGVDARSAARVDRSRLSGLGDGVCVHVAYLVGEYVMGLERERLASVA